MWEVFLYINPLCSYCLKVERSIIDFTRKNNIDTQYHFVTTYNMATITDYMLMKGYKPSDLEKRNEVTENIYEAACLYKAAACQGNKKARNLLMNLQDQVNVQGKPFNEATVKIAAENSGLNFKAIVKEKGSEAVKKAVKKDQELTCEMGIKKAPTVVVFDDNHPRQPGVMLTKFGSNSSEEIINENLTAMLERAMPQQIHDNAQHHHENRVINLSNFRR